MPASQHPRSKPGAAIDEVFRFVGDREPGASVMVMQNGRVVVKRSYGLSDVESRSRASSKSTYRLASVSKQFTAAAILLLAENGRLSLDDDLTKFFPGFPGYGKQVRIRHLLNHTSGVLAYEDLIPAERVEPVVDNDVLEILRAQDHTYFPPGSAFRYSNSGYALLACIVEAVSRKPYGEFLSENIFRPLGMSRTFLTRRDRRYGGKRAYGYSKQQGRFVRTDQSMTSFVLGDGGIYSSLDDLAKWEQSLENAALLPKKRWEDAMSATTATTRAGVNYGYGWYVGSYDGHPALWHDGTTTGFRNHYLRVPGKGLAVIVLANRTDIDAEALARQVADRFLK